ncbi:MAG: thioredoxin domain-containing protein [Myxococcaceae bacterium]|nr:thioredoxin domain-containing protein [Myxococcaceae bacterium]
MASTSGKTNRLSNEHSPYLTQHAHNPVDWYPWGEEALTLAKKEDRPILLSVGYSACHWCHVMAHESFEDAATAELMNRYFVNIKVDREERPDVDQLYQGVVQLLGRGGGWPLTVFLTPDLRPFFGGTYFPKQARYGLPGFGTLLESLHDAWKNRREEVEGQAAQFKEGLAHYTAYGLDSTPSEVRPDDVVTAARGVQRRIDPVHGGFGGAPKFPNPMNVAMLLRGYRRTKDRALLEPALLTLHEMATGGIYDQLGGGFHRYSVDAHWAVPHFEKMLYDNAQLIHLYSEAYLLEPRPLWKRVVEETVAYLQREMISDGGGFCAAQDADSEGEEGKFFSWTPAQVAQVLPPQLTELACRYYGISEQGNFEHGSTVLSAGRDLAAVAQVLGLSLPEAEAQLAQARQLLFDARKKRIAPTLDDKVLTGWNGLALHALAFAARVFQREDWKTLVSETADALLKMMRKQDGSLWRAAQHGQGRIDAMLEDYGNLALGLLSLYQATFDVQHVETARGLIEKAVALFWDDKKQAYTSAPKGQADLLVPTYALHDNAFPSGASTLTQAQVMLAALLADEKHLAHAHNYVKRMRDELIDNPMGYGHLWLAADAVLDGAAEVTVVETAVRARPFLQAIDATFFPTVAVRTWRPGASPAVFGEAANERKEPGAYVCKAFSCQRPVSEPAQLLANLEGL